MNNIIFLEIDGVLNDCVSRFLSCKNRKSNINIDDEKVLRLKEIIDKTNSQVVITSFERNTKEFIDVLYKISNFGIKIVGFVPTINGNKSTEIIEYLASHNTINNYVILDCEDLLDIPTLQEHLVQTPVDDGIQDYHITEAIKILKPKKRTRILY